MSSTSRTLSLLLGLSLAVVGCVAEDVPNDADGEMVSSESLRDCPTILNGCYVTCQGTQPTPDAQCFLDCDASFRRCIGLEVEVELNQW